MQITISNQSENHANNEHAFSVMSHLTLHTNYHLKLDFQKGDQLTEGKWSIHDTKTPQGQSVAKPGTHL